MLGGIPGLPARFINGRCVRALATAVFLVVAATPLGACGRWTPAKAYQVETRAEPPAAYRAVNEVLERERYKVIARDSSARTVRVRSHVDESSDRVSQIAISVAASGEVTLAGSGHLVRADGTMHKKLAQELARLESRIRDAVRKGGVAAASSSKPSGAPQGTNRPAPEAKVPRAWSEPAYDPATWGPGKFTCIPVKLPADDQHLLALRLSTGERADVALSLAYAPELCRSPAECSVPGGCPALGIGDAERVAKLAERIVNAQVSSTAVLVRAGTPVATIDLAQHGSVLQAIQAVKARPSAPK